MDAISMQGNGQQGVRTLLENEICLPPSAGKVQLLFYIHLRKRKLWLERNMSRGFKVNIVLPL